MPKFRDDVIMVTRDICRGAGKLFLDLGTTISRFLSLDKTTHQMPTGVLLWTVSTALLLLYYYYKGVGVYHLTHPNFERDLRENEKSYGGAVFAIR